jgi:hypothetical protein
MKTKIFKLTTLTVLLLVLAGELSCRKEKATIIGRWKLKKVEIPFTGEFNDYSQYNIVYEFKTNNVLTITGEVNHIDNYRGHSLGEYFYSFIVDDEDELYTHLGSLTTTNSSIIKIDGWYYFYSIFSKELKLDQSPIDGFIYHLIKTK